MKEKKYTVKSSEFNGNSKSHNGFVFQTQIPQFSTARIPGKLLYNTLKLPRTEREKPVKSFTPKTVIRIL